MSNSPCGSFMLSLFNVAFQSRYSLFLIIGAGCMVFGLHLQVRFTLKVYFVAITITHKFKTMITSLLKIKRVQLKQTKNITEHIVGRKLHS